MSRLEYGQAQCTKCCGKRDYNQEDLRIVPTPIGDFCICPECRQELIEIFMPYEVPQDEKQDS